MRPAVGVEDGRVEIVVELSEHGHQALLVDDLVLGRERLARAKLFEHVVRAGDGEIRMPGLLALPMGVELFGEGADAALLSLRQDRKRERIEAGDVTPTRTILQRGTCHECPREVYARTENAEEEHIVKRDGKKRMIGQCFAREKLEHPMLGCLQSWPHL